MTAVIIVDTVVEDVGGLGDRVFGSKELISIKTTSRSVIVLACEILGVGATWWWRERKLLSAYPFTSNYHRPTSPKLRLSVIL